MNVCYCVLDGLLHRLLLLAGYKEVHRLDVDGDVVVKMKQNKGMN